MPQDRDATSGRFNSCNLQLTIEKQNLAILLSPLPLALTAIMSFDHLSSLESQPTNTRRQDDPQYADDPEFQHVSKDLMSKLLSLGGNVGKLQNQVSLLGTKRETERVRERVQTLLEELKDSFKDAGEGVKKIQSWDDVSVSYD